MPKYLSIPEILDKITEAEENYLSWVVMWAMGCAMVIQDLLSMLFGPWASIFPWLAILAGVIGCCYNQRIYASDVNGKGPHA